MCHIICASYFGENRQHHRCRLHRDRL